MFESLTGLPAQWWAFVILGAVVGAFGGMVGLGGGVILIPVLVLLMGFSQKSAQAMSLAFVIPIAVVAAIRYRTTVGADLDLPKFCLLTAGGLAGVLVGTAFIAKVPDAILSRVFACVLIALAVKMLIGSPKPAAGPDGKTDVEMSPTAKQGDGNRSTGGNEGSRR
jgi:uncharacterized membrane protein YfcA